MAMSVHLELKANGSPVEGESTVHSLDRENTIECLTYSDGVRTAREAATGRASGERTYEPITITKRIDKSSPLLARALCNNERMEGKFRFYRPSATGDGTIEQYFTIEIKEGHIAGIHRFNPDVFDPAAAPHPATEEVSFVFGYIRWTHENDGIEHVDHWSRRE